MEVRNMFCKNCGKEIDDKADVCIYCGVKVDKVSPQPEGNGMAVAGFVCSFFIPLLGWIFGGIGLARSGKRGGKGKGLFVAALVIATISFIIAFALL